MFTCVACGDTPTEECAEHTYGEWVTTTAPTCTESGIETRVCSVCGYEDTRTVGESGHSYGTWQQQTEPTCKSQGKATRTCACGDVDEKILDVVDHVYENGKCKWCDLAQSGGTTPTRVEVKSNVKYGGAGASDWETDSENGIYRSKTATNAHVTFTDYYFEGGIIEWDMTVPQNAQYAFSTVCGITFASPNDNVVGGEDENDNYYCFGRAFTGEYVGFSKLNGAFTWQDYAKLSTINCAEGVKNHFILEYDDANNVIYLTYGDQSTFLIPTVKLNGKYFGLYSEVEGTVFENITVTKKDYTLSTISPMNQSEWKEETVDGVLTYTALSDVAVAVLKGVEFTTGSIEWDMTVPDGNFVFGVMCGLIWGAESDVLSIHTSQYLCSGMYPSGIFVTYSKVSNGAGVDFRWENAQQIDNGTIMARNTKVHYKITYDGTNLTLEVGGQTVTLQPTVKAFGKNIALYSELAGTVFSNVTVTPLES